MTSYKSQFPVVPPERPRGVRRKADPFCTFLVFALMVCVPAAGAAAQEPAAEQQPDNTPAQYVGMETCAGCHVDVVEQFRSLPHAELLRDAKRGWQDRACEACHGPGSKHAESMDPKDIIQPAKIAPARADKVCLSCHANQKTQVGRVFGSHARNEVACVACHTIHTKPKGEISFLGRENTSINQQCAKCHTSVWAQFQRPHHHKLPEGAMNCTNCHNPHGSPFGMMARTVHGDEQSCVGCHADKRGPFVYEHAVVRTEGCTACHEPHGSANPRMLTRAQVQYVCLECHSNLLSPNPQNGTIGGVPPAFHDLRSPRFRNCTDCHQKIHGSNVSRSLLR